MPLDANPIRWLSLAGEAASAAAIASLPEEREQLMPDLLRISASRSAKTIQLINALHLRKNFAQNRHAPDGELRQARNSIRCLAADEQMFRTEARVGRQQMFTKT